MMTITSPNTKANPNTAGISAMAASTAQALPEWLTVLRAQFPFFSAHPTLTYLDNGATSQKPAVVIDAMTKFLSSQNANVHRGVYRLAEVASQVFEGVRRDVAMFLGGVRTQEIIFTSGTTAAINLIANSWGGTNLKSGDEILLPISEHHSNIVPWQMIAARTGAVVKFIPLDAHYRLDLTAAKAMTSAKTKVIAFAHVSNVLGTILPVADLCALAKSVGAISVIDGAQGIAHMAVDVRAIGADFYVFSGHKMCGPTGIGVLYGREALLEAMPPFIGGGDMIETVTVSGFTPNLLPFKFEAGTPPIAEVIGLGATVKFLQSLDRPRLMEHERSLGLRLVEALGGNKNIKMYTNAGQDWTGIVSMSHTLVHPHDLAAVASHHGVCVRAGHHCAQPLMTSLGAPSTTRVSPFYYNTPHDIDRFVAAVARAEEMFT